MSLGVHSEVGRLRKVLVCRPGLAHKRLTPENCRELLFDDVLWVAQARNDHNAFTSAMLERGVQVLELHDLLADTVGQPLARDWLLDRMLGVDSLDAETAQPLRTWLTELSPQRLAEHLIGGVVRSDLPFEPAGLTALCAGPTELLLALVGRTVRQQRDEKADQLAQEREKNRKLRALVDSQIVEITRLASVNEALRAELALQKAIADGKASRGHFGRKKAENERQTEG